MCNTVSHRAENTEILVPIISFNICNLSCARRNNFKSSNLHLCTITAIAHLLIPYFMSLSLLKMSAVLTNALNSFSISRTA